MTTLLLLATALTTLSLHLVSALIAARRLWPADAPLSPSPPPVTVVRPVCGLDDVERETLASTFHLPTSAEIIFCAARDSDAAVPYLRDLIAQQPSFDARILIGSEGPRINPKLDNVRKGWRAARNDWVIIVDSNVLIDRSYVCNLLFAWRADVGAVCAPPFAVGGRGWWAEVETQFLNGYQARWQYAADAVGEGFAQGKSMLFRKSQLEAWGGIAALDIDAAEDAATTKVVRQHGLRVRLAGAPVPQPIGCRSLSQVWQRQCRWAQLRRKSFPGFYALEPLTMLLPALTVTSLAAAAFELSPVLTGLTVATLWFASEAGMLAAAGCRISLRAPVGVLLREIMLPIIWLSGWRVRPFAWRQTVDAPLQAQPT